MAKDPICGMDVDEREAEFTTRLEHENYYFCSRACQDSFEEKSGLKGEKGKKWWQRILKEPKGEPPKCH